MSYQVDRRRWQQMSIQEQMGNIYSEVGRAFLARERGQNQRCQQAVMRALDLFSATVEGLVAECSPRAKEVSRAKDQFLRALYGELDSPAERQKLEKYFRVYALAMRRPSSE